jgi:GNAT superfamily N-acetyltransferase
MGQKDLPFAFECLAELRGIARYTGEDFADYVASHRLLDHPDFRLLIGECGGESIGMLTCNRFAMPRYLGFGYEIEEVVVHPRYQGRQLGHAIVAAFLEQVAGDPGVRKVLVKTDDMDRAGRIYSKYFGLVEAKVFGRAVNKL